MSFEDGGDGDVADWTIPKSIQRANAAIRGAIERLQLPQRGSAPTARRTANPAHGR